MSGALGMDERISPSPSRAGKSVVQGERSAERADRDSSKIGPQRQKQRTCAAPGGGGGGAGSESREAASPATVATASANAAGSDEDSLHGELTGDELIQEGLKPLRGERPSISVNQMLERVRVQAVKEPASIRRFLETTAKELAIEAGCTHVSPLKAWNENPSIAETCGQFQAHVLGAVDLSDVLARQRRLDRSPSYCLPKRVRNQMYYETLKDLGCTGAGNQIPAGPCMKAAIQVFAGEGKDGLPPGLVKALCVY